MRTATITFHAPNNNGSFFQAYALQKVLTEKLGVENEILDFRSEKQVRQYSVFRPVRSVRDLAKNGVSLLHYEAIKTHNQRFEAMRERCLNMTPRCASAEEAVRIADRYDAVIAGSDQIWNTGAPDFSPAYLLPGVRARKIAYAISFGSFSREAELLPYKKELEAFYRIAVREESARRHLRGLIGREAELTLDPTLLLDGEDYRAMTDGAPLIPGGYIFFYSISYPEEVMRTAKRIAERMGLPIVTVFTSFHTVTCEKHGMKVRYDAGPEEFLNLVMNARLVLTNSFHGTAFSLLLHKPFYHLGKTVDGQLQRDDRIAQILEAMELRGCSAGLFTPVTGLPRVDWDAVDEKRRALGERSLAYLREALR